MSNGTAAGTTMVKDINPTGDSMPFTRGLFNMSSTLFFAADDGSTGLELWKSNGTEAGTTRVKDINPGSINSDPEDFAIVNGVLFFNAFTDGEELWMSNGTEAGTTRVKDINPGAFSSAPSRLTNVNGTLFFTAFDGTDRELWSSDGTEAGTIEVMDIWPGTDSSSPRELTDGNGALFFTADDGTSGRELWREGPAAEQQRGVQRRFRRTTSIDGRRVLRDSAEGSRARGWGQLHLRRSRERSGRDGLERIPASGPLAQPE
jgi:ELWxxDGT repeat protein